MARPKKDTMLRHTHPVMLRFTDTEYERLLSHAEAEGFPCRIPSQAGYRKNSESKL